MFKTQFAIIILLIVLIVPQYGQSQKSEKTRIAEIEKEIPKAVDKGDYEKAASLKKEKETLEEIVTALERGDYEKAANLKEGLENGSEVDGLVGTKSRLTNVNDEISKAVDDGNYEKAAELKKEKELLEELIVAQEKGDRDKIEELQSKLSNGNSSSNDSNLEVSPEFVNQVYIWDQSTNNLKSMEKQKGTLETSTSAAPFYAKSTSFYKVDGEYSSIRKDSEHSFVIKVMGGQDPRDLIELVIFEPGKDGEDRYMPYFESSGHAYGGSSGEVKDIKIPVSIKKVSDQVYEIIPDEKLENGEYGFKVIDKFYCFGIGPKGTQSKDQGNTNPPEDKTSDGKRNKLTKNGYFLDLMPFSIGSTSDLSGMVIGGGIKMGNKFYSKREGKFKPGFALNYARIQLGLSTVDNEFGYNENFFSLSLVGVGFASVIQFKEHTGLEANLDAMVNFIFFGPSDSFGVIFIPNVKYRYKAFSMGVDLGISTGVLDEDAIGVRTAAIFSLTAGVKF